MLSAVTAGRCASRCNSTDGVPHATFHPDPHVCSRSDMSLTQDTALTRFGHQLALIPVFLTAPGMFLSTREVLRCLLI